MWLSAAPVRVFTLEVVGLLIPLFLWPQGRVLHITLSPRWRDRWSGTLVLAPSRPLFLLALFVLLQFHLIRSFFGESGFWEPGLVGLTTFTFLLHRTPFFAFARRTDT